MRPPENWRRARVTLALAGSIAAAWGAATLLGAGQALAFWAGFIPARVAGVAGDEWMAPVFLTPLTAAFVHAGAIHLAFNLLIHLFCGRAVEGLVGGRQLLLLFVVGAYAAAALQYVVDPQGIVPMVGASGAISALLGAYALLFGRNRVKVANPTLALWLNALWLMAAWIALQLVIGFTFSTTGMRIAIAAHIGGFVAGLALAKPLLMLRWRGA
jgi:membrane associated rhomboid family serine protease